MEKISIPRSLGGIYCQSRIFGAFVPVGFIVYPFKIQYDEIRRNFNGDADDILDYFEDTHRSSKATKC